MALEQGFIDSCGNSYAPAHWRCVAINVSAPDQRIGLVFYAYKDLSAFQAGKQHLTGGVKQYTISGQEFGAIAMAAPVGLTLYDVLAHAAESYALGKKDVDSGQKDEAGNPVLVSFFDGAVQV